MKLAIVAALQAFRDQVQINMFERAKNTVERNGYTVTKKQTNKKEDK